MASTETIPEHEALLKEGARGADEGFGTMVDALKAPPKPRAKPLHQRFISVDTQLSWMSSFMDSEKKKKKKKRKSDNPEEDDVQRRIHRVLRILFDGSDAMWVS